MDYIRINNDKDVHSFVYFFDKNHAILPTADDCWFKFRFVLHEDRQIEKTSMLFMSLIPFFEEK